MDDRRKIVINTLSLLGPLTGIGNYTKNVIQGLITDPQLDLTYFSLYFSKELIEEQSLPLQTQSVIRLIKKNPLIKKIVRRVLREKVRFHRQRYDLYFEPNIIPLEYIKAKRIITTIHDLSVIRFPEWHPKERVHYFKKKFFSTLELVDFIITDSNFIKKEIIEILKIDSEKIRTIPLGVDQNQYHFLSTEEREKQEIELFKDRYPFLLFNKFILFVGSIEPRKNLLTLLQVYDSMPQEIKKEYHLILTGFSGWNNREIMELIQRNHHFVHYLGYVTAQELTLLYNMTELFVYPSLYEGFGLPPLEAMACGAPVMVSDAASLTEVCGQAAYYTKAEEPESMRAALLQLLHDAETRNELREKGMRQVRKFSWEQCVKAHRDLFYQVMR